MSEEQLIVNKATALKDLLIAEHGFTDDRTAKRNTHAFVLDTPNKNRLTISAFIDETHNDQWVFSAWLGAGDTNILKDLDTSQDIEQIAQQIVEADNLNPNTTNEQGEQNVQMNNDNSQNNNAVSDDQQFLERVVAGTEDMSSADFGDKLIAIAENLDPALEALFEQATDAYANYAISLEV